MSTIALLCIVALVAVVIVGLVGAFASGTTSLDEIYARHRARQAAVGDTAPADPWITDARTHPGFATEHDAAPEERAAAERIGARSERQPA